MNNYLITGGAGFIGSTLANYLSKENSVIVIDDLSMGKEENLDDNSNLKFINGSVTDKELMEDILSSNQFDYIFHLAAIASVADSVERPVETHQINFESVLMLLELIRKYQKDLKRLVFSSSAAVYGDEPTLPKHEESVIRPLTPYAVDKFAAEQYVLDYNHLYGVKTSAVRFLMYMDQIRIQNLLTVVSFQFWLIAIRKFKRVRIHNSHCLVMVRNLEILCSLRM